MFKKLIKKVTDMAGERVTFDPASFNDPIAIQTDWKPAKKGGANFQTHQLVTPTPDSTQFRASGSAKLFYTVFLILGLGFMIVISLTKEISFDLKSIFPLLIGLVFAIAGGVMLYFGTEPIVFDKKSGAFWKGRKSPNQVFDNKSLKDYTELDQIHALQLISEKCRSNGKNRRTYYSYELNLVLKNGDRINVVDHGKKNKLRDDTQKLSAFLEIPVWDAS